MKKNLKRTLAKVMAVALTVALAGTAAPDAAAAKKIKLSSKSITVAKGKTKKVTIKNVKKNKVKKLTVKSSKKKVATVKASGKTAFKVTGKKAGSAKITATVTVKGQKKATKLTLNVKVKGAVTPTPETAAPTASAAATTAPASQAPGTSNAPGGSQAPAGPGTSNAPGGSQAPATDVPATQEPVVESYATEIKNINLAGEMKEFVRSFAVTNGSAAMEMSANATYDHVYTYFDYKIPAGATLDDILAVKFDYAAEGADCQYKSLCVLAGDPETFPMKGLGWDYNTGKPGEGAANVTAPVASNDNKNGISTGSNTAETNLPNQELQIVTKDLKKVVTGDTVRFCIYLHIQGSKDNVNTKYTLSNIKVMSKKEGGTDVGQAPTAINNTAKAEAVAAASVDTMKIEAGDESREITLTVPKTDIEAYGVTITKVEAKAVDTDDLKSTDILSVTAKGDNAYTVKLKSGYTLPADKDYVTPSVKVSVSLNTGGVVETKFDIVVGDDSVVDISTQLGKKKDEYILLNFKDAFKVAQDDDRKAQITLTQGRKSGVDILTYDVSKATYNGNLMVGWDFSTVDMAEATEVIFLVKSEGASAKVTSVAGDDSNWLSDVGYMDPKADEFTKVTISKDKFKTCMGIKNNSWNGVLDIYAVAVVGGKAKTPAAE